LQLPLQLFNRLHRRYYDQYSEISTSNDDSGSQSGIGSGSGSDITMGSSMSGFYQADPCSSTDISSMNSAQSHNVVHDIEMIPLRT
jgi:hypothetical protein